MWRNLSWGLLVAATALLQTTWLDAIRVGGAIPDLTLLIVLYFALMEGEERAMATGALGGVFQDVAEDAVLGHNVLCNVLIAYAVGRLATRLVTEHPAVKAFIVLCACLVRGILYIAVLYVQRPDFTAFHHLAGTVIPGAFYSALCTPVVFLFLDRTFGKPAPLPKGIA